MRIHVSLSKKEDPEEQAPFSPASPGPGLGVPLPRSQDAGPLRYGGGQGSRFALILRTRGEGSHGGLQKVRRRPRPGEWLRVAGR